MSLKKINRVNHRYARVISLSALGFFSLLGWFLFLNLKYNDARPGGCLGPDGATALIQSMGWYHTRATVEAFRSVLMDPSYRLDVGATKIRIKNIFKHQRGLYTRDFNRYQCPIDRDALGNWYQNNFDFDQCLADVFEVVFDETVYTKETNDYMLLELKTNKIRDIIEQYQNETAELLNDALQIKGVG